VKKRTKRARQLEGRSRMNRRQLLAAVNRKE
jgi:hypothetical protein